MNSGLSWVVGLGIVLGAAAAVEAQGTIDATPPQTIISTYPTNGTIAYSGDLGQVILAPGSPDVALHQYQFLGTGVGQGPVQFKSEVFRFDNSTYRVIGGPLYTSDTRTAQLNSGQYFTFLPGDVPLQPGQYYLLTLLQTGMGNVYRNLQMTTNYLGGTDYADGYTVKADTTVASPYATQPFTILYSNKPGTDMGFSATLYLPEPSTLTVVGLAATLLLSRGRARQVGR